ncbi:YbaN family protein [Brevundimonas sp.]|uniref:YbaN family protein n=1 Tax=Brevundimonas sp. TaxID=1871086 RepID=UPI002D49C52E|nr:DUF454 family protein [Brevundimonas sp.]HYC67329.1 DUF454 family protein [Brevundimonas sp.]
MTRPAPPDIAACACDSCPPDLCCFGECHCTPPAGRGSERLALRLLGGAATALALAGVILPLLPTTPFLLLAAWAFARSSPRLDGWLRAHPRLGPPLAAWEARRAIPRSAKAVAGVSLPAGWLALWAGGASVPVTTAAGAAVLAAGLWILSRPS